MATTRSTSGGLYQELMKNPSSQHLLRSWLNMSESATIEMAVVDLCRSSIEQRRFSAFLADRLDFGDQPQIELLTIWGLMSVLDYHQESITRALTQLAQQFDDVIKGIDFVHLDVGDLLELLHSPALFVRSEAVIVAGIDRWLLHDAKARVRYVPECLQNVQWSRWSQHEQNCLNQCSSLLQQMVRKFKIATSSSMSSSTIRRRQITVVVQLPDPDLHSAVRQYRMGGLQWQVTLQPQRYEQYQSAFYGLQIQLLPLREGDPLSDETTFPFSTINMMNVGPPELRSGRVLRWNQFGDSHDLLAIPLQQLGPSYAGLVIGDEMQIRMECGWFGLDSNESSSSLD